MQHATKFPRIITERSCMFDVVIARRTFEQDTTLRMMLLTDVPGNASSYNLHMHFFWHQSACQPMLQEAYLQCGATVHLEAEGIAFTPVPLCLRVHVKLFGVASKRLHLFPSCVLN